MGRPEEHRRTDQVVKLKIGNNYPWPIFPVDLSIESLREEGSSYINFIGKKFNISDISTIKRNLLHAEKRLSETNIPAEITQYIALKKFEELTNKIYSRFRSLPGNEEVNELTETNTHHGYIHQRRLEKHLKKLFRIELELRSNPNKLFLALSQFISIRFHDILELFPNGKELHTEGGALAVLGFLNENRELFNQILEDMGMEKPDDKTWLKIITSTFVTCLYHSKPKLLAEVQKNIEAKENVSINDFLVKDFSLSKLFDLLPDLLEKHEDRPVLFNYMLKGSSFLKKNSSKTVFTKEGAKDLIESAKIFSAIDKLDSVLPAELSTARTFVTMKDSSRSFFRPIEDIVYKDGGEIENEVLSLPNHNPLCLRAVMKLKSRKPLDYLDEYYLRIALAEGSKSPDDFSRLLFETQRVDFPDDLPNWIKGNFKLSLEKKGDFLLKMVPDFLSFGNIKLFQQIYLQAEASLIALFLSKYGAYTKEEIDTNIRFYLRLEKETDRFNFIKSRMQILEEKGAIPHNIFINIDVLRKELRQLEDTLKIKKAKLDEANLTGVATGKRAKRLLEIAVKKRVLPEIDTKTFSEHDESFFSPGDITLFF